MMMKFKMGKINVDQFAILSQNTPTGDIDINVNLRFKYSLEARRIAPNMQFSFKHKESTLVILEVTCEFEIHPDDWKELFTSSELCIPKSILEYFGAQTVGTSRGIMHCKTEGTPYNGIVLPPIDITQLVPDDIHIPL